MSKKGPRHHSTEPGCKVSVKLRNGDIILGRFKEKNRSYCLLRDHKRIPWSSIRSFRILKGE